MMRLCSLLATAALLSASLAAHADTIQYNLAVNGSVVGNGSGAYGVTSNSFSRFDSTLGTLNDVTFTFSGTVTPPASSAFDTLYDVTPASDLQVALVFLNQSFFGSGAHALSANATLTSPAALAYFEGAGTQGLNLNFSRQDTSVMAAGTISYNYTAAPVAVTPEPSSLALFGTGLLGVVGVVRKRLA